MGSRCYCLVGSGVFLVAVDDKFAEQKLGDKVGDHGHTQHDVLVNTGPFCQRAQVGRQGSKDQVEAEDLSHSNGDIGGRLEGIAAV